MQITHKQIREYLGHDGNNCKVVIHQDATIDCYGSPDIFDRSMDYWYGCGTVAEIKQQIENEQG